MEGALAGDGAEHLDTKKAPIRILNHRTSHRMPRIKHRVIVVAGRLERTHQHRHATRRSRCHILRSGLHPIPLTGNQGPALKTKVTDVRPIQPKRPAVLAEVIRMPCRQRIQPAVPNKRMLALARPIGIERPEKLLRKRLLPGRNRQRGSHPGTTGRTRHKRRRENEGGRKQTEKKCTSGNFHSEPDFR